MKVSDHQRQGVSCWSVPITRIETAPSICPSDIPGIFCPSGYIGKATLGFNFQTFFPNVQDILLPSVLP